jgi:predicted nucleic acid-binding Zn ribbon protein
MPIYTYRCSAGHEWDEVRSIYDSQTSTDPCAACLENVDALGIETLPEDLPEYAGKKVPAPVSVSFKGKGWTPTHYTNRKENK